MRVPLLLRSPGCCTAPFTVLREFDTGTAARRYARVLGGPSVESGAADWAPYALLNGGIALHDYTFSPLDGTPPGA